ncbi:uncharacterized protein LOC132631188 [Lycium barbarum]|uniref:uncharacterized protein LOC132631188 n=1 Tax=Lycium barbarum TaxID=112863 RepID=UPI00293E05B7|nr:uncharacterized protein LOC132631188 [Lycium barbarum]
MMLAREIWISILLICTTIAKAQNITQCASSCGAVHEISFPFRLKADPLNCGDSRFELDCQNNRTVISLNPRRYYVLEINYHVFLIRAIDPGLKHQTRNCTSFPDYFDTSVPRTSTFGRALTAEYHYLKSTSGAAVIIEYHERNIPIINVNCLAPVNSLRYVETTYCGSQHKTPFLNTSQSHSCFAIGQDMSISDLAEKCSWEMVAWASAHGLSGDNTSLSDIHAALTYGYELSWKRAFLCRECEGYCFAEGGGFICHRCKDNSGVNLCIPCKSTFISSFTMFKWNPFSNVLFYKIHP